MSTAFELSRMFERTLAAELAHLRAIPESPATARPNRPSGKGWSQREELGHLIDSAVNNHGRFVRASLDGAYAGPDYEQNGWVHAHRYVELPWTLLVDLWHAHNVLLVPLIAHTPDARLAAPCTIEALKTVSLGGLIEDYVLHMQHHLDQIHRRPVVTRYPSQGTA